MQSRKSVGPDLSALDIASRPSDRFAYQNRFVPFIIKDENGHPVISAVQQHLNKAIELAPADQPTIPRDLPLVSRPGEDIDVGRMASDFGVVLLERTRITPTGFALGEHLLSLSLAPGEEVTIEQKAYSERTVSYEDVSETDAEISTEVGSSLTTELSLALTQAISDTKNKGYNAGTSATASYYGNYSLSGSYVDSINSAMTQTQAETVRNTINKTQKLTARRRAQHKISVKVSETSKFEIGSKRVLRNPNQFTPIDLIYFKILQKVDIAHERFGIRLCWAPFVRDPGVVLDEAIMAARQSLESQTPLNLPPAPIPPTPPANTPPPIENPISVELNKWGWPWGDMSADYEYDVAANQGYKWDGDERDTISSTLTVSTANWGARGTPTVTVFRKEPSGSGVKIFIHGGAGMGGGNARLFVDFKIRFIADTVAIDVDYQKKLSEWKEQNDEWKKEVDQIKADRTAKIEALLEEWKKNYMKNFDPVSAGIQLLIALLFPVEGPDAGFEVEMWNKIFDFEQAGFQYYPAWWSKKERRNPEKPPDSFENASWMRVFLQIRPGFEHQALNLIIGRRVYTNPTDQLVTHAIEKVLAELTQARTTYFGGVDEIKITPGTPCPEIETPYICLGHWSDLLPTDGTHLEVVEAMTTAIDEITRQSLNDAHAMMTARINSQQSESQLTSSLKDRVSTSTQPTNLDVVIKIGNTNPE